MPGDPCQQTSNQGSSVVSRCSSAKTVVHGQHANEGMILILNTSTVSYSYSFFLKLWECIESNALDSISAYQHLDEREILRVVGNQHHDPTYCPAVHSSTGQVTYPDMPSIQVRPKWEEVLRSMNDLPWNGIMVVVILHGSLRSHLSSCRPKVWTNLFPWSVHLQ